MTKPTDDLEAVRVVAEALQGFDARDQERIIRWAREKLGLVPSSAVQLPPASGLQPPTLAGDIIAPPAAPSKVKNLATLEEPVVEQLELERPEEEQPALEEAEVEQPEVEQPEVERPGAVNILMPAAEQKNRVFIVIGIILLTFAVAFLIVMITSHAK
jgi:hypothetical protein